jgi:hypothetical protein
MVSGLARSCTTTAEHFVDRTDAAFIETLSALLGHALRA